MSKKKKTIRQRDLSAIIHAEAQRRKGAEEEKGKRKDCCTQDYRYTFKIHLVQNNLANNTPLLLPSYFFPPLIPLLSPLFSPRLFSPHLFSPRLCASAPLRELFSNYLFMNLARR